MDTTKIKIYDIADDNGLQIAETTTSPNGYPGHVDMAIVGFDTFAQAKELEQKLDGYQLQWLKRKDGQSLWYRTGNAAYEPLTIKESDFGDNFNFLTPDDLETFIESEVAPFVENCGNFDELEKLVSSRREVYDALLVCGDDEVVVTECGDYYDTIELHPIRWSHDTENIELALVPIR